MRGVNLTKLTSRDCRQHAFDFEIVVNVGARLSLLERLAYTVKATGNRDNLMGLYLSGKEKADDGRRRREGGGGGGGTKVGEARSRRPERPRAVKGKFRGPIYRTRLSPREKEIGIETKITDPTLPAESPFFVPPAPRRARAPTHTSDLFPKRRKSNVEKCVRRYWAIELIESVGGNEIDGPMLRLKWSRKRK